MNRTAERILSEKVQELTGLSLIEIHSKAMQLVQTGLAKNRLEALEVFIEEESYDPSKREEDLKNE